DRDRALLVEQVGDRPRLAEVAAVLREQMPDVGPGAVAVVGDRLHEDRDPARSVSLVEDALERLALAALAGSPGDRAFDVVLRHRGFFGLPTRVLKRGVGARIAAAVARRDGDRPRELGELLAPARIDDSLLVLDARPLRVSGHV